MKRFHWARRVFIAGVASTLLLAGLLSGPALATEPPAPAPTTTPVPAVTTPTAVAATSAAPTPTPTGEAELATSSSVLEVSPELSLTLEVVEGPVRNETDGTYTVTYELVVTQSGGAEIEPQSLLGFTTTDDVVSNEAALEQNAELASEGSTTSGETASASTASPTATPAPTATATATAVPEIQVRSGLGLAKRIVSPPKIVDGAFEFTYEVTIQNIGQDAVTDLRVVDDLGEVFGADASIDIQALASDGQIQVNDSFDGIDDVEVIASGATLAAGKMARVSVSVAVVPTALGVYEMNAAGAGVSESGVNLMDVSTDGRVADTDDDDDASDDNEPTPVSFASEQTLDLGVRVLRNASEAMPGVFSGTLALTVSNPGPFEVEELQMYEAFANSGDVKLIVESATSDSLSVNPWFDGRTDIELLSGDDSLAVGATGVIVLELATSLGDLQDISQIASAEAVDLFGVAVKAGTGDVLAAAPTGYTKSDSDPDDDAGAAEPATTSVAGPAPVAKSPTAAAPQSVEPPEEPDDAVAAEQNIELADDIEVASAALEPTPVSGALRRQYQVAIAGLIALVLTLVGGGTAAGINRRERKRSRQVTDWLHTP